MSSGLGSSELLILVAKHFSALFSSQGQPGASPLRLALVTILQYVEGLTDRQAADAVRSRIDWKYLLCLELTDTGFDRTQSQPEWLERYSERMEDYHLPISKARREQQAQIYWSRLDRNIK